MNKIFYCLSIFVILILIFLSDLSNKYKNFAEMPILNDGRIKPLESFARANLNNFFNIKPNKYYSYYLAEIIFSFNTFSNKKVFRITDDAIITNIDIKKDKNNIYSFNDIFAGIFKNIEIINTLQKSNFNLLTNSQIDLLNLYDKIFFILNLHESFKILDTFIDSNKSPYVYNNTIEYLYIIKTKNNAWTTLNNMELLNNDSNKNIITTLLNMKNFYITQDYINWNATCATFNDYSINNLNIHERIKLTLENLYNKMTFLFYSVICYFIFFLTACLTHIKNTYKKYLLLTGFLFSLFDLILRLFISERPPVTNLYESIIFVNFICAIFFIWLFKKIKTRFSIILIACSLFLLQIIGYNYNYSSEIKNLMAVLNTNFWLTLHVLTITTGYACCLISSVLGHIILYYLYKNDNQLATKFVQYTYIFLLVSLFFSFNGTILGGIWADQSWGRFWGWDPKENGALLIVLWLTLILHVRLINKSKIIFSIGVITLSVMVAISWFGVNILNIGLHSYGFTKGMISWLGFFILIEIMYICFLMLRIYKNNIH